MVNRNRLSPRFDRQTEQGIALVVVLVFLLALTAISLYGARQAVFGERVARNTLDAQVARQAAEAALRDGETDVAMPEGSKPVAAKCERDGMRPMAAKIAMAVSGTECKGGVCKLTDEQYADVDFKASQNGQPWWPTDKGGKWNNAFDEKTDCNKLAGGVPLGTFTGKPAIAEVAQQPEYLIEYIGLRNERPLFRITARGFGYDSATQAVVQSYFVPPESE